MIVLGLALALPLGAIAAEAESKKFTLISVIFDGTKVWLPSTLIVHEGDQVGLTLINKLDAPHGFKIESLGIDTVLQPLAKTTMWFTEATLWCHRK